MLVPRDCESDARLSERTFLVQSRPVHRVVRSLLAGAASAFAACTMFGAANAHAWSGYAANATPSHYVPVDTWTSTTPQDTGRVDEVVRVGATTYLGGNFTKMRSQSGVTAQRTYIASVDAITGALNTGFNVTLNGRVTALEASPDGTTIFIGGEFTTVNGAAMDGLAALNASTGALKASLLPNQRVGGTVYDLAASASSLYVAGNISSIGGASRSNIARLELAGGAYSLASWKSNINGRVNALEIDAPRNRVVVGGSFTAVNGQTTQRYIAAVKTSDGAPLAWADHPPASSTNRIIDLDVTASGVYAAQGGSNWARAYELSTGKERWSFNSDGDNQAIAEYGGMVVVGFHGNVTATRPGESYQNVASANRPKRDKIFMLNATTGALQSWAPSLKMARDETTGEWHSPLGVWSLDAVGGQLYVGGDFGTVNGKTQNRFAIFAGI